MKILFFGDSITDAGRDRESDVSETALGCGYVKYAAQELTAGGENEVINRGISGHRVVDLYARIKVDCWNLKPDVLSILIGVNDVWHELYHQNGVEIDRFEKVYRMLLEDTKKVLPDTKIILCEPFVLQGAATMEKDDEFLDVYNYAKLVKRLAEEYGCEFLPLQDKLTAAAETSQASDYLSDGVHPAEKGAMLIADEWVKLFREKVAK